MKMILTQEAITSIKQKSWNIAKQYHVNHPETSLNDVYYNTVKKCIKDTVKIESQLQLDTPKKKSVKTNPFEKIAENISKKALEITEMFKKQHPETASEKVYEKIVKNGFKIALEKQLISASQDIVDELFEKTLKAGFEKIKNENIRPAKTNFKSVKLGIEGDSMIIKQNGPLKTVKIEEYKPPKQVNELVYD